jgi:hypothetical protein
LIRFAEKISDHQIPLILRQKRQVDSIWPLHYAIQIGRI